MKENDELKKASEKLDKISQDEHMRRIAEWREKAIIEENTAISAGFERGFDKGHKEGLEQGHKEGLEQGHKEGLEEGIKEEESLKAKEIAIKLLKNGLDINFVQQTTNLSIKEIEELQNSLK